MHALIEQFAAAGKRRIGAPFALIAGPAAVAVAAADEQQRPDRAGIENRARLLERAVIAMVESHAHQRAGAAGGFRHGIQLAGPPRARLLDEHVFARARGFGGDRGQHIVRGGHDHHVDHRRCRRGAPVGGRFRAGMRRRQSLRPPAIHVAADRQPRIRRAPRALVPDQAAAGDGDIEGHAQSTC